VALIDRAMQHPFRHFRPQGLSRATHDPMLCFKGSCKRKTPPMGEGLRRVPALSAPPKRVHAQNVERELTEVATKYSLRAQKLERELTQTAIRAQKLERELTETATRYSLWGQKLERELNRIDPDGAPSRRFGAKGEE
jgi:hypothetical protein